MIGVGLAAAALDLCGCIAAVDQQGVTIGVFLKGKGVQLVFVVFDGKGAKEAFVVLDGQLGAEGLRRLDQQHQGQDRRYRPMGGQLRRETPGLVDFLLHHEASNQPNGVAQRGYGQGQQRAQRPAASSLGLKDRQHDRQPHACQQPRVSAVPERIAELSDQRLQPRPQTAAQGTHQLAGSGIAAQQTGEGGRTDTGNGRGQPVGGFRQLRLFIGQLGMIVVQNRP